MSYKSIVFFNLPQGFQVNQAKLEQALRKKPLRPCGELEIQTSGAVPVTGRRDGELTFAHEGAVFFKIGTNKKMLPKQVIEDEVNERVEDITRERGDEPGKKERNEITAEVIKDLLARAFTKRTVVDGFIDNSNSMVVIGASSFNKAEEVLGVLREVLGSMPATPPRATRNVRETMTGWVMDMKQCPEEIWFGDLCEMVSPDDKPTKWTGRNDWMIDDIVGPHIREGQRVRKLGIDFRGRIQCVLKDDLSVASIRFDNEALNLDGVAADVGDSGKAQQIVAMQGLRNVIAGVRDWFAVEEWEPGTGDQDEDEDEGNGNEDGIG